MPNRTIYILDSDIPKWAAIRNRSAWIHERLNEQSTQFAKVNDKTYVVNGQDSVSRVDLSTVANVPKPAEMTDIRWLNHLKKHGLDPNASLIR
jgi:hypothetical protein